MKITTRILVACLPGIVAGALFAGSTGDQTAGKTNANETALSKAKASMAKMPLAFEPNRGQTDPRVQYLSRGPGYTVFFTKDETVFALKNTNTSNAVVRMRFVGGNNSASAQPLEALPNTSNYLIGNDSSKWHTDVAEYSKLRYENVYPGIDVVYQGQNQQLRYDFVVKPGASASSIELAFQGADNIAVNKDGDLVLTIGGKNLVTKRPFTYQEDAGAKKEVASHFVVKNGRVTFELAKYDATKDVVIDPTVFLISYLGGNANDSVTGVAIVNTFKTISTQPSFYYVTGTTTSTNFPGGAATGQNPPLPATGGLTGQNDAFVSKISYNGATLVWSTYIGGNGNDSSAAIAVDTTSVIGAAGSSGGTAGCTASGCPVIVGTTVSLNFPTIVNNVIGTNAATGNVPAGGNDAFASKLSSDGKTLLFSEYIAGVTNDFATGVAVDASVPANIWVGGYTDSQNFPIVCPAGAKCANAGGTTQSSDSFVVKLTGAGIVSNSVLYGGFGEEFARGIAYNPTSSMVYLGGDTTTAPQNFPGTTGPNPNYPGSPLNVLPGVTNNTGVQYTVGGVATGLPGAGPNSARGGFVVAFDAATLTKTFASYVAVGGYSTTANCAIGLQATAGVLCSIGTDSINGIASEGGAPATINAGTLTNAGSIGHIYITGVTTSNVPTNNIAAVVPGVGCAAGLNATGGLSTSPAGGQTIASGCTTALVTQAPFNINYAPNAACPYPLVLPLGSSQAAGCNLAAFVAILDGALLAAPTTAAPFSLTSPIGNQIEYWAYYSSVTPKHNANAADTYPLSAGSLGNSSAVSNAIAIDTNPTTNSSVYSLGYYQQMYITGTTTITTGNSANQLPTTQYPSSPSTNEIFTPYNVGTTSGGGVGGLAPTSATPTVAIPFPAAAFVARFNPNGLAASAYGGNVNLGGAVGGPDRSPLLHTPQFNYGEFLYSSGGANNLTGTPDNTQPTTIGNAIAVDVTRAVLVGGVTNNSQVSTTPAGTTAAKCPGSPYSNSCEFTTSNGFSGGQTFAGGTDGWVAVMLFNDILTNANAVASANPYLEPGAPTLTTGVSYMETSANPTPGGFSGNPPPFGPTFDFAISDAATATQTFEVIFTGQTSGQLLNQTPFFVPLDARSGANPPTWDNGNPGSGIVYYLPCYGPGGNPYPAPGSPYTPGVCINPPGGIPPNYQAIGVTFSGWPGVTSAATGVSTPGWLLVSQDINPGVVRMQLDRRAAAGLLEGTYVAQFLVNTYDPNQNMPSHPYQWPPCATGLSETNPFVAAPTCTNGSTPIPADNESILVTVRLVVRPTLFLSRNAGFLTGVTSSLQSNPLYGSAAFIDQQDGTSQVSTWLFADNATTLTVGNPNTTNPLTVNSGPPVCFTESVPSAVGSTSTNPLLTASVALPCEVNGTYGAFTVNTAPPPYTGATYGAAAYLANGPGDVPSTIGSQTPTTVPNINFLYDAGTVQSPNIAPQQLLATNRFDAAPAIPNTFNSDFQGGLDPESQRNDVTLHDYYIESEGAATLSIGAVNCIGWGVNNGALVHNNAIGPWLTLSVTSAPDNVSPNSYLPICTDLTPATIGTTLANASGTAFGAQPSGVVTACPAGCNFVLPTGNWDDAGGFTGHPTGQKVTLDFLAKAFSNRAAANGIPTGFYTATVYVWSTRAKNSAPGYCLGASMPASNFNSTPGVDPVPLCGKNSSTGLATDANPNPEVLVGSEQMFTVSLFVFDTTQIVQITQSSCPTSGFVSNIPVTQFVTVANSENLFSANPLSGFVTATNPLAGPTYPQFGPNGDGLVEFSLLPFQTTGQAITTPCPSNNTINCVGGVGSGRNFTVPLPAGVTVNAQTLAAYNACSLPTGKYNGNPIDGSNVPGIGSLQQGGALSQITFVPNSNGANPTVTIYACRPTDAPAWLNSVLYPGNNINAFAGAPEPYSSGNGATADPVPSTALQTCALQSGGGVVGTLMPGSKVGIVRNNVFNFDSNGNESGPAPNDPADRIDSFAPPGGVLAGDIAVVGDWAGTGHTAAGWFRPSTGSWWLDANNDGVYTAGVDFAYTGFGGPGNVPVIGDWAGLGKSAIGVVDAGFLWELDLNADGVFQQPTCPGGWPNSCTGPITGDAVFAFGSPGDFPVVGNWYNQTNGSNAISQVGMVRSYVVNGVAQSGPFLWMLDSGIAGTPTNVTPLSGHVFANAPGTAFGGGVGDIPVTGDWNNNGVTNFGDFRAGFLWVLDGAPPTAPQNAHFLFGGTGFAYGGVAGDKPIVGKW
jgi:hypothetical protein